MFTRHMVRLKHMRDRQEMRAGTLEFSLSIAERFQPPVIKTTQFWKGQQCYGM